MVCFSQKNTSQHLFSSFHKHYEIWWIHASILLFLFNQGEQVLYMFRYHVHHAGIFSARCFLTVGRLRFLTLTWGTRFILVLDLCRLCDLRFLILLWTLYTLTALSCTTLDFALRGLLSRLLWTRLFALLLSLIVLGLFLFLFVSTYTTFFGWGF